LDKEQEQAARAQAAEQEARAQAAAERDARKVAEDYAARARVGAGDARRGAAREPAGDPFAGVAEPPSPAQIEQAQDEVELLEAQLEAKRAQLSAVELSLKTTEEMKRLGSSNVSAVDVATLTGQVRVKQAELKEADVRLGQAKRRLARLQG